MASEITMSLLMLFMVLWFSSSNKFQSSPHASFTVKVCSPPLNTLSIPPRFHRHRIYKRHGRISYRFDKLSPLLLPCSIVIASNWNGVHSTTVPQAFFYMIPVTPTEIISMSLLSSLLFTPPFCLLELSLPLYQCLHPLLCPRYHYHQLHSLQSSMWINHR